MAWYADTYDMGDGTPLGLTGPFETKEEVGEFFENPILSGIRWELLDEPYLTPEAYLATFEE